ncbi:hypothetical protein P3X46_012283 [Hevea brasiliensis]|uniref:Pentacotripeptide-repeat region of PRORP domain-containing protein n=1 Tax=Hevea brasiliensis TaxID=3981 RepID=A0ABQ9MBM7_HEVBR|nr:pentatricopeptide repeat-containing protein At2g20710, mitochondrial [Hevea brasiliensis]KAJ9177028.1 hypothetical protein P3X46_012283 [Hevea brasiliensis]
MKLLPRSNANLWRRVHVVLRAQLLPSDALTSSSYSSSAPVDSLHRRISRSGNPAVSIVTVIEKWLEEGKSVEQSELRIFIKQLRKYRRFKQALQISQWMSDQRAYNLSPGDVAIQLDLITKVYGLDEAERYFHSIPDTSRGHQVYGSLLNCYAHKKCLEKAEGIMQKMKELQFVKNPLAYNVMLNLYSQMGKYEKLDILMEEMEEKGINCDMFTFNVRLNAYAASSDIEGMEKLLMKMEADPVINMDFHSYVTAANGYLKAGLIEKALMLLKRSEQLIKGKSKWLPLEMLLTLYAAAGNKDEVYRVWNLYKNNGRFLNSGYSCMISSLAKLDDLDGAERIWEEWDSGKQLFDIRIANLMIGAYSKRGLLEKAEACINKIIENGMEPDAITWDHLATGYRASGQMKKAVEAIKKAISTTKRGWKPSLTLASFLEYLKGKGDIEAVEDLLKMVKEHCHFSAGATAKLSSFISKENLTTNSLDQKEDDDEIFGGEQQFIEKGST